MQTVSRHTSFSSLSKYDECPSAWKARRIDKVVEPPSKPLEMGIILHEIFAAYDEELYSSGLTDYAAGMPAIVERIFASNNRVTSTAYYDEVLIAAKGYAKVYRLNVDSLIGLEIELRMPLGENYPDLLGYVDIAESVNDGEQPFIGITDRKTGWGSTVTEAYKFQRKLYGLMMRHKYPNELIGVRNHFTRAGIYTPWELLQPWDYDSVLGQVKAILQRMEVSEQYNEYPATPNPNCGWCPIAARCEVVQNLRRTGNALLDEAEAKTMVAEVLALDAARDARVKTLKTWVNGNGPVVLDNGAAAGFTTPQPSPTVTDIAAFVSAMGEEAYPLLRVDGKAIKKFSDDSRLDDLWVESMPRPQFKVGKAKGDDDE